MIEINAATFINLTPHVIHLPGLAVPPSGTVARCVESTRLLGTINGVRIITREYGDVLDLPDPKPGVFYIVSHLCRVATPYRLDLLSPGDFARDAEGCVRGCTALVINH